MMYEKMKQEQENLENQIHNILYQLEQLPDGNLICSSSGKYCKWYVHDGKGMSYLPKGQKELARKLAIKKYLQLRLKACQNELRTVKHYLRLHSDENMPADQLLQAPEYHELLASYFTPALEDLEDWQNAEYEKNALHPEGLTIQTLSGIRVRTRAEALIDAALFVHQIPFRYECVHHLESGTVCPSFTTRHPETGKTIYWEHFKRMKGSRSIDLALEKLKKYFTAGIFPKVNLITTFEAPGKPISRDLINHIIDFYYE